MNRDCPLVFDVITNTTTYIGTCAIKACRASWHSTWNILFKEPGHICIDDILKVRHQKHLQSCNTLVPSARTNMTLDRLIVICSSCEYRRKFDFTFHEALMAVICGIDIEVNDSSHEESIDSHYIVGINQRAKQ